jgi:hypothetical protein
MVVFCFFVAFILRKKIFLSIFSLILRRVSDTCLKSDGYEYGYDFSSVDTYMNIKFYLQTLYRRIGNYSTQVKLKTHCHPINRPALRWAAWPACLEAWD